MYRLLKPVFDYILAVFILILAGPFLLLIALIQLFFVPSPLFIQERPGKYGRVFKMIKFRTLRVEDEDASMTSFGRLLRFTSLDELPQVINVLRGEMSFVGPRPLLKKYLPHYSMRQRRRHEVKPGITGLAQIKGRNRLSWEESLEWDVKYVENYSFRQDIYILYRTVFQLFRWKDVNGDSGKSRGSFHD